MIKKYSKNNFKEKESNISMKNSILNMTKYITAYDPKIKRRVLHVVRNGWAISVITGSKFKYDG